jgi:hypothetical protein
MRLRLSALVVLGCLALVSGARSGDDDELDLHGARLGMPLEELLKLSRKRHRDLVGPGKGVLDYRTQASASEYAVEKNRLLEGRTRDIIRQTILVLNKKVVAVEFIFKRGRAFDDFLEELEELGYKPDDAEKGLHVGALKTGAYKGLPVEVRIEEFKGGRRRRRKHHKVQVRCLQVLGKDVTMDTILRAQGKDPEEVRKRMKNWF